MSKVKIKLTAPFAPPVAPAGSNPFEYGLSNNLSFPPINFNQFQFNLKTPIFNVGNFGYNFNVGAPITFNVPPIQYSAPTYASNLGTPTTFNTQSSQYNEPVFSFKESLAVDTFNKTNNNTKLSTNSARSNQSEALAKKLIDKAQSYIGVVNSDADGNRLFSNGKNQAWCADFATVCPQDIYRLPSDFRTSSVLELQKWGIKHNCYKSLPSDKSKRIDYAHENVKKGNIGIADGHTFFVKEVQDDKIVAISGNYSNKVSEHIYKITDPRIKGFISLDKFA